LKARKVNGSLPGLPPDGAQMELIEKV